MEKDVLKLLAKAGIEADIDILERPPKPDFGDIAFPCFGLAKKKKKSPNEIADDIKSDLEKSLPKGMVEKVDARGGYVNFFLNWDKVSEKVISDIMKKGGEYGKPAKLKKQKIMVEYSQPNPVHSMHIGHARGTFLGDALANLYEFMGHKVIRANYMNDSGLQVAKLVTAIDTWAKGKKPKGKEDEWLWKYYVKFHEEAEKNPELNMKARDTLKLIDVDKDKKTIELRDKIVQWCIDGFEKTYKRVGISFDMYLNESKFRDEGKKIVKKAMETKINGKLLAFESDEGTIVADLEDFGLPGLVILRSDGTGLYQTSDLGMTVYKFEHYNVDKAIWVVASAQNLYFSQIKKLLELLGYKWVDDAIHFSFDLVRLPEGKMSSRKGKAVLLDEVLDELVDMAEKGIESRGIKHSKKEKEEISRAVGVGALKYAIAKVDPEKGITFDFKSMMSFEGNTGPYLQYAHTRCSSILDKSKPSKKMKPKDIRNQEIELVRILSDFPKIIQQSVDEMKINLICNYAYDVANAFSSFYNSCSVLKADTEEQRNFRLGLVSATKIVLKNCLVILGIEPLERM